MSDDEQIRNARDAIRDHVLGLDASPETRRLVARLADPSEVVFDEDGNADASVAVASALRMVDEADAARAARQPAPEPPRARGRRTPAIPPAASDGKPFEGFITPGEYASLPDHVRLSEAVQKRLERSRRFFPDFIPASSFPRGDD